MAYNIEEDARGREAAGLLAVVRVRYTDHTWSNNGPVGVVVRTPDGREEYVSQSCRLRELAPYHGERLVVPANPPADLPPLPPGHTVE